MWFKLKVGCKKHALRSVQHMENTMFVRVALGCLQVTFPRPISI